MSVTRKKMREDLREPEPYQVQIHLNDKLMIVRVHSSAFALETVFESLRSKLLTQAFRVVKDRLTAEDIVQSSLLNAYCCLNNGTLYAIKLQQNFLVVRGNGSTSARSPRARWYEMQEEAHKRWFFENILEKEETYTREATEPAIQKEWLARTLERWLKGMPVVGLCVIEEPSAWIQKIVLNNALKYYNQRKKYREFLADPQNWDLAEDPRCPNPEKELLRKEEYAQVRQYVATLPVHYRRVLELRYFQDQDYSFQAIAERLNRPVHTVTSQASRALKMLREVLEEQRIAKNDRLSKRKKQI